MDFVFWKCHCGKRVINFGTGNPSSEFCGLIFINIESSRVKVNYRFEIVYRRNLVMEGLIVG